MQTAKIGLDAMGTSTTLESNKSEFPGAPHTLVPDNLIGINSHGPAQQQKVGIQEAPASQPSSSFPLMIPAECADSRAPIVWRTLW